MSKQNWSGDVSLQRQINNLCELLQKLELNSDNFFDQLQWGLGQLLYNRVIIYPKGSRTRKFPVLEYCDRILWIYYFYIPNESSAILTDIILLQLSIAILLSMCPKEFTDNLRVDETVCSFSERFPYHANLSTQIYNVIRPKLM